MENNRVRSILQKKRRREKRMRMMMVTAAVAAGLIVTGFAVVGIRRAFNSDAEAGAIGEAIPGETGAHPVGVEQESDGGETETVKAAVFPSGSHAGTVDLTGLTPQQAEAKLDEAFAWKLQVTDGENQAQVPDYLSGWLAEVKGVLQAGRIPEAELLEPDYGAVGEKLAGFVSELAGQWNRQPVNSQAESYDRTTGAYTYSQASSGRTLNQEALAESLRQAVESGNFNTVIEAEFTEQPPERDSRQAKEQYQVIGTFTTKTTDNKNRNQNIKLAVDAIDGTVLKPGQEFSFNLATGNRTSEKGYQPAGAYKNGILIEEPGGGVCQVSTTLYHAIIQSGYRTTERNAHSFAPSYVEKGQDAMVSFDGYAGPDLKFINTGKASVVLRAAFSNRELKMSIVGLPLLDEGVEVSIRSEKVRDVEPGEASYVENTTLPYGTEKTVDAASNGSVWKSYRVLKKNGEVVEEQPLHNSRYKAKTAVIQRNTTDPGVTGAENPAETKGESGEENPAESGAQAGGENPAESGAQSGGQAGMQGQQESASQPDGQIQPGANIQPGGDGPTQSSAPPAADDGQGMPLIQPYAAGELAAPGA